MLAANRPFAKGEYVLEVAGKVVLREHVKNKPLYISLGAQDNVSSYCLPAPFNLSRFVHHNCQPNTVAVRINAYNEDPRVGQICLWALRDLAVGEVISVDWARLYNFARKIPCHCGAGTEVCKGTIPYNP
jgi:hypothetical protein